MPKKPPTTGTKPTLLTLPVLAALEVGQRRRDTKVKGLFAERGARAISLKLQADLWQGPLGKRTKAKTFRKTLGHHPELSIDAARAEAHALLAQIKQGIDPDAPKQAQPGQMTVTTMFRQAQETMTTRERRPETIAELGYMLTKYLPSLADKAATDVKPSTLRAEHKRISDDHGKTVANKALRAYRSAFNIALKEIDDPDALGVNPVRAVTFHPERKSEAVIEPTDLRDWYQRLQQLPNALRRLMHEMNLFSGMRPGLLMTLERSWVQLDKRAIVVPHEKMKSGRHWALPLSAHMVGLVERTLVLSDMMFAGSIWLYPSKADGPKAAKPGKPAPKKPSTSKAGDVVATQVIRERTMPSETGHILRHTHATLAKAAGVDDMLASLLSDHKVAGIRGVYVHERALFEQLLAAQEQITAHILSLIK